MSVNIRYPNITSSNEREQITQIRSYLHQLVDQLNYVLPTIGGTGQTYNVQGTDMSYYDLRSLIMSELSKIQAEVENLEQSLPAEAAAKLTFTLDEEGNLYYEVLEE